MEIKRTFKQVGDKVVVKNHVEDTKLSPKEVIESIEAIKNNIKSIVEEVGKNETNIENLKANISQIDAQIPKFENDLKELDKFVAWAEKYQLSKLKNLIEEVKDECYNKVVVEYTYDKGLNNEGNNLQRYRQYQHKIATHKKVTEAVAQSIVNHNVIIDSLVANPWK